MGLIAEAVARSKGRNVRGILFRSVPKAIKIESLSKPITDSQGNVTELGDTIADDKAIDIGAWLDARTFLLQLPATG